MGERTRETNETRPGSSSAWAPGAPLSPQKYDWSGHEPRLHRPLRNRTKYSCAECSNPQRLGVATGKIVRSTLRCPVTTVENSRERVERACPPLLHAQPSYENEDKTVIYTALFEKEQKICAAKQTPPYTVYWKPVAKVVGFGLTYPTVPSRFVVRSDGCGSGRAVHRADAFCCSHFPVEGKASQG